jgi:hypothetical protein
MMMEEQHGTKLNGMHTTSVVISRRFAEFNGQNVIPIILKIRVQEKGYGLKTKMCVPNWLGYLSRYSDSLQAGRSGDQVLVGVRYSAPIQTGSEANPASYTVGAGSFLVVKWPGVVLSTHLHLAPRLEKE